MGSAAYNRGSALIRRLIDREVAENRARRNNMIHGRTSHIYTICSVICGLTEISKCRSLEDACEICEADGQLVYQIFDGVALAATWTARGGLQEINS